MNAKSWKAWLVPGGLLFALTAVVVNSPIFPQVAPALGFYYFAAFVAGLLLAWRFHSSRVLFSLLTLLLAHRSLDFFSTATVPTGPGHTALLLAIVLIPLNFVLFASMRERGLTLTGVVPRAAVLFLESVAVAVLCRPETGGAASHISVHSSVHSSVHTAAAPAVPAWLLLIFPAALAVFIRRFLKSHKPIEVGFAWETIAIFLWLDFAPLGKIADAYVASAALILAASLIETSYVLAYHDELTGIRGRRAFNEALLRLDQQYAIAIVDIDHFKKFNDTYGHDVGDQVLCMVASRISKVPGGGEAFRCGGEEFAIIFRDASAKEAFDHLDILRQIVEKSIFQLRGAERRSASRASESDRRRPTKRKAPIAESAAPSDRLSVTVSIGVAEPSTRYRQPEQVIQAADQALYRAKQKGRNRVELASTAPLRLEKTRRAKATRL